MGGSTVFRQDEIRYSAPMSPSAKPQVDNPALVAELAASVSDELGLASPEKQEALARSIARALSDYERLQARRARWRPAKEQRKALRDLHKQLLAVRATIRELSPEYLEAIGNLTGLPATDSSIDLMHFHDKLGEVSVAVREVQEWLHPPKGPPANDGLGAAIQILLPTLERLTGEKAGTSWNKNNAKQPEPNTASSAALVKIIRRFPYPPSQTAILNKVERIRSKPQRKRENVEDRIREILRELEMSLLPGRNDQPLIGDELDPKMVSRQR